MARSRRDKPSRKRSTNDSRSGSDRNYRRRRAAEIPVVRETAQTPAKARALEKLLSGIGTPEPAPFKPDDFQLEALEAIENEDVLVTAPTGSGKTWIAREEIRRLLAAGKRAWYTTPLKAPTNSKFIEFGNEFGPQNVGILTGDRKENWDAPLIVGTTEIYRNQLFDALRNGEQVRTDFVILDEAHYIADEDRGHVWERRSSSVRRGSDCFCCRRRSGTLATLHPGLAKTAAPSFAFAPLLWNAGRMGGMPCRHIGANHGP